MTFISIFFQTFEIQIECRIFFFHLDACNWHSLQNFTYMHIFFHIFFHQYLSIIFWYVFFLLWWSLSSCSFCRILLHSSWRFIILYTEVILLNLLNKYLSWIINFSTSCLNFWNSFVNILNERNKKINNELFSWSVLNMNLSILICLLQQLLV